MSTDKDSRTGQDLFEENRAAERWALHLKAQEEEKAKDLKSQTITLGWFKDRPTEPGKTACGG